MQSGPAADLEVQGLQLGPVHGLTDVLVGPVEGEGFVSEKAIGRHQLGGLVGFAVQSAVQFGKEEVDLIRCFLRDGVKLKHLCKAKQNGDGLEMVAERRSGPAQPL